MKKLYIVRHAKSSWKNYTDDFERKLKAKGELHAPVIAEKMNSRGAKIESVISSSAKRAKKTAKLMAPVLGIETDLIAFHPELYLASKKTIMHVISQTDDHVNELMLVGHNPGVTDLVNHLAKENFENVPTCGVACVLLDITSWSEISKKGTLGFFIYPKLFKPFLKNA